ncbi:MAG: nucleoside triphosphate pyrophosphohydrolase [Gammaproteobacteria bacterium]
MDNVARLMVIVSQLRDPEVGCPWDLRQTFASIAPHTLEETYELVEAIERGDADAIRDELGDLLLQVIYHAHLAYEQNLFSFDRLAQAAGDKLVRRHPHVFGDTHYASEQARETAWEAEKARERAGGGKQQSALGGVTAALPALTRARKLQKRAANVGFDWPDRADIFAKIDEEIAEVREVLTDDTSPIRIEEEIGDLLFCVVNVARRAEIDPERALRVANRKFERRFKAIEARLAEQNRRPEGCTLAELDALWDEIKKHAAKIT